MRRHSDVFVTKYMLSFAKDVRHKRATIFYKLGMIQKVIKTVILSIPEMLKQLGNINMLMFGESLGRASFEFDGGRVTKKLCVKISIIPRNLTSSSSCR